MKIAIVSFTNNGTILNKKVNNELEKLGYICKSYSISRFSKRYNLNKIEPSLKEWTKKHFKEEDALIFISASGIAVRAIAPFVKDKKTDPAVIVIDELGRFVIPLLSGHIGGANELSKKISKFTNSIEVITTATDINNKFAVDVFAKNNNLYISNMTIAKEISSKILEGEKIGFLSDFNFKGNIPSELVKKNIENIVEEEKKKVSIKNPKIGIYVSISGKDIYEKTLNLIPKIVTIGIGCRKGTDIKNIEELVFKVLKENNISIHSVKKISSIDLKKDEEGIKEFSKKYNIPFKVYSKKELEKVEGNFTESDLVKSVTGISNVCERAAIIENKKGKLKVKKTIGNKVTLALYIEKWGGVFE